MSRVQQVAAASNDVLQFKLDAENTAVLLPWVERLARRFILARDVSLVAELPADERDVVLDLAAKWARERR